MNAWLAGKTAGQIARALFPYLGVLLLASTLIWLWVANQRLNQKTGALEAALETATAVNQTSQQALTDAVQANQTCMAKFKQTEDQNARALENLAKDYIELEARKQRVQIRREEIFREPSCKELGEINIAVVCPTLATRLRNQAHAFD